MQRRKPGSSARCSNAVCRDTLVLYSKHRVPPFSVTLVRQRLHGMHGYVCDNPSEPSKNGVRHPTGMGKRSYCLFAQIRQQIEEKGHGTHILYVYICFCAGLHKFNSKACSKLNKSRFRVSWITAGTALNTASRAGPAPPGAIQSNRGVYSSRKICRNREPDLTPTSISPYRASFHCFTLCTHFNWLL